MPEKILIVGSAWPFRGGGISTFNQVMARELQKMGYEVRILTFTLQYPSFLFPGKTQYADEPAPSDLTIDVKLNSISPFNWLRTGWHYRKQKPDLVIFRFWTPFMGPAFGTLSRLIKGNNHSRVIAITDNVIPHEKSWIDRPFTHYFLKACDAFLCMSRAVLQDLENFDRNKPKIYHPHPLYDNFGDRVPQEKAREYLGLSGDLRYFLFFGFIRPYKGLDLLLEAFAKVHTQIPDARLMVAGEFYEDPEPYLIQIEKLGIKEKVILKTEFIPDDEVKYYFSSADLVTQTYRHATQSGVTQIAYHFGIPMLVTDVGGLAETVPHHQAGYVVNPKDDEIAGALLDFFTSQRSVHMKNQITALKERFGWPAFLKSLLSLSSANNQ